MLKSGINTKNRNSMKQLFDEVPKGSDLTQEG